jgi:drug/metabolite transporter (DMT)-like permease
MTGSILLLLLAMVFWGSTYVVTKEGLAQLPPLLFALLRFGAATALLVPLALWRGGTGRLPRPAPWGTLALMGLTGVALYYLAFNVALQFTTASQGALIQSSIPAVTAVMAILWLGERVSVRRGIGIALAMAGVLLIVARSAPDAGARSPVLGNALMFASVLVWGAYTMLAKRLAHVDPVAVTAVVSALGTLMLVPVAVVEALRGPTPPITPANWLRVVYLGAFPSAAAYLCYGRALRELDASQVGTFINLVPVIGVASGVVILGDRITATAILGGVFVLAGVWLSARPR